MTFDEMEVGKWYWFRFTKPGGIVACGVCIAPGDEPVVHRLMTLAGNLNKSDVTDITPVLSQSEWAALQSAIAEKDAALEIALSNLVATKHHIDVERHAENSGKLIRQNYSSDPWEGVPEIIDETTDQIRTALQAGKGER